MGANSTIEWTHHTFNPWIGCTKVSPGCANCYAERDMDHRRGRVKWGKGQARSQTTTGYWRQPEAWDRAAAKVGERHRVFCASLADVFDDEVPANWRADLFALIDRTPNLDWLLLTKRPQNIRPMLLELAQASDMDLRLLDMLPLPNVWLGTSAENQEAADERIPHLLDVPAVVRFLSCEPLLGPVDLRLDDLTHRDYEGRRLDWIIAGGESGPRARAMNPLWAQSLRDQALGHKVAFFFKQWGEFAPAPWEDDGGSPQMMRVGKVSAGRHLDGRTWDDLPAVELEQGG